MDSSSTIESSKTLPPWNVILHNDDEVSEQHVIAKIMEILRLDKSDATRKATEADANGQSLLLTTHLERAELIAAQFASSKIMVTAVKA